MSRRWLWLGYWVLLGVPTIALGIFEMTTHVLGCDIGWGMSDCPVFLVFLMPLAAHGFLTAIPFLAIGSVWLAVTIAILIVQRGKP